MYRGFMTIRTSNSDFCLEMSNHNDNVGGADQELKEAHDFTGNFEWEQIAGFSLAD